MTAWKSALLKPAAWWTARSVAADAARAVESQKRTLEKLLRRGRLTAFGREHGFDKVGDGRAFARAVPMRDYEEYRPWIDRIRAGEADVTWPGRPLYYALTSGTTSATKQVPLTREIMPAQYGTTRKAMLNYYGRTGKGGWLDGTAVVLVGSPALKTVDGVPSGLLSGIINHHVPAWFRSMTLPSKPVMAMTSWQDKMAALVEESRGRDVRLLGGSPAWMLMYFEYLLERTGRASVKEVFPNLSVYVHGGVDYGIYRAAIESKVGGAIDTIDVYSATESFVAFQAGEPGEGMLLNLSSGFYFEFVAVENADDPHAERLTLDQVEVDRDYVIVISTCSGFWGYVMGDTVRFTSVSPPQIIVTGRTKNIIAVANERLYAKEVDDAMIAACAATGTRVSEFTVAPQAVPEGGGRPFHEWFVEFDGPEPQDRDRFVAAIDAHISGVNYNYGAFRRSGVLAPPRLHLVRPGGFRDYMKSIDRMGGQFKLPRLQTSRSIVDALPPFLLP
ncbi:MAG: GH3 auxin-responsive promoter family protein [Rhizobiaceae bacterium]